MNIDQLAKKIEDASEDERFDKWRELYFSRAADAKSTLYTLINESDATIKILFTRFLAHIEDKGAIVDLTKLLNDDNDIVVEAAIKAFRKNVYSEKWPHLLGVIRSSSRLAQFFAIDELCRNNVYQVVSPLIKLLDHADDELLIKILSGFKFIPDKRMIEATRKFLTDKREKVRFQTILVFASLHQSGVGSVRQDLLVSITDPQASIRRLVLWALRLNPSRHDLPLIISLSQNDADPTVRQEALHEFKYFPKPYVIEHLVKILDHEQDRLVLLKAEGVLLSMPTKVLIKGVKYSSIKNQHRVRTRAVLLFAEFQRGQKRFRRFLHNNLAQASNDKEKVLFLEALGIFEDPKSLPVLHDYLDGSPLIAYTAMVSILNILKKTDKRSVNHYLIRPNLSAIMKQIILRFLVHGGIDPDETVEIQEVLKSFLKDANINVRYLASQVLLQIGGEDIMKHLLDNLYREENPTSVKFLKSSFKEVLATRPEYFISLLKSHLSHQEKVSLLVELMADIHLHSRPVLSILKPLIGKPIQAFRGNYQKVLGDFLMAQVISDRISLGSILTEIESLEERQDFLGFLAQFCRSQSLNLVLPYSLLKQWFEDGQMQEQKAILELMALDKTPMNISFLVARMKEKRYQNLSGQMAESLNQILKRAC